MKRHIKILAVIMSLICALSVFACSSGADYDFEKFEGEIARASEWKWYQVDEGDNMSKKDIYTVDNESYPFFSDKADVATYFANAMFQRYTNINTETPASEKYVITVGGYSAAWFEWMTVATIWSTNELAKSGMRKSLINCPQNEDGYIWSWGTMPHWSDVGIYEHHNYHYDNVLNFVIGVCEYCLWENSTAILDEVDTTTYSASPGARESIHNGEDKSRGRTVGQKLNLAIQYIMRDMHGADGLIILDENCHDGRNLGVVPSNDRNDYGYASNYWDNVPFGYKDAYENMLFCDMLNHLIKLEQLKGDSAKSQQYATLCEKAKKNYNDTFWDNDKKRYIQTIDVNGVKRDYGATYLNTQAICMGIADQNKVKHIYAWMDGLRIIESDTSKGADIYKAYKTGGSAPRSNTLDYAEGNWWHNNNGTQALSANGYYGYHCENGGAILYTEFYDLLGRIKYLDAGNGLKRMYTVATEYAKDELRRDPPNLYFAGNDVLGYIGEFPESGLVPSSYLYGFVGVDAVAGGISLEPNFPEQYEFTGVKDLVFGGAKYNITVHKNGKIEVYGKSALALKLTVKDYAGLKNAVAKIYKNNVETESIPLVADNGYFTVNLNGRVEGAGKVVIEKA